MMQLFLTPYPKITRTKREEKKMELNANSRLRRLYMWAWLKTLTRSLMGRKSLWLLALRITSFLVGGGTRPPFPPKREFIVQNILNVIIWRSFTGRDSSPNILGADQLISDPARKIIFCTQKRKSGNTVVFSAILHIYSW